MGLNVGEEFSINLDSLANNDLPDDVRKRLEEFLANSEQRTATFNNLMAVLSGLVNSALEEQNFGTIDYDGPQVIIVGIQNLFVKDMEMLQLNI